MTPARVIFAGDGQTAVRALEILTSRSGIGVVGLLLHAPETIREGDAIRMLAPQAPVINGKAVNTPEGRQQLAALAPDWLISFNYSVILNADTLAIFPPGQAVNMHTGLLPEQRGRYPNFWALHGGGPAGVTLHVMTPGVDEGNILVRCKAPIEWTDTAGSLHARLQETGLAVLSENLDALLGGELAPVAQSGDWPTRRRADFLALRHIDLDARTTPRELFNHLRAFSFPGDTGADFDDGGERFTVSISIARAKPSR